MAVCSTSDGLPSLAAEARSHEPGPPAGPHGREDRGTRDSSADRDTMRRLHIVDHETYPDWESIYLDNVQRLYRLMYARVGNRPDAEDLTSEVFVAALRPLRTTASKSEVRAYLIATARTTLAAYWRRKLGM